MQHSSRRNPCPVCGRNIDDKCRWSNTRIYCYAGDSFSPPSFLRIGDKIKIAGEQWRLFSLSSGFSQNSYAFALYEGEEYRFLNYEDKREFRKSCIRLTRLFMQREKSLKVKMDMMRGEDCFYAMNIDSFYFNKKLVNETISLLADMADFSFTNRRHLKDSGVDLEWPKLKIKELKEFLKCICAFECLYFGHGSPDGEDFRPGQPSQIEDHASAAPLPRPAA